MVKIKTRLNSKPLLKSQPPIKLGMNRHQTPHSASYVLYLNVSRLISPSQACGASLVFHHFTAAEAQRSNYCCSQAWSTNDALIPNPVITHSSFQQLFGECSLCVSRVWRGRDEAKKIIYKAFPICQALYQVLYMV